MEDNIILKYCHWVREHCRIGWGEDSFCKSNCPSYREGCFCVKEPCLCTSFIEHIIQDGKTAFVKYCNSTDEKIIKDIMIFKLSK